MRNKIWEKRNKWLKHKTEKGGSHSREDDWRTATKNNKNNRLKNIAGDSDRLALKDFFYHLPDRYEKEAFAAYWKKIDRTELTHVDLSRILQCSATYARDANADEIDYFKRPYIKKTVAENIKKTVAENFRLWHKSALRQLDDFNLTDLAMSLNALSVLGLRPPGSFSNLWLKTIRDRLQKTLMGELDTKSLPSCLYACANLGIEPPPDLVDIWGQAFRIHNKKFEGRDLAKSLAACAILDSLWRDNPQFRETASLLYEFHRKNPEILSEDEKIFSHQAWQACLWLDFNFNLKDYAPDYKEDGDKSTQEKKLCNVFSACGSLQENPLLIEKMKHEVDGSWKITSNGKILHLEADGVQHFITFLPEPKKNGDSQSFGKYFNGSTIFQTALIKKLAPEAVVLRIPDNVGTDILRYNGNLASTINEIIDLVSAANPDAYYLGLENHTPELHPIFLSAHPRIA